jgi:O-antigen/teichoic acid export membrane protein
MVDASHALIRRGIAIRLIATVIMSIAGLVSTVLAVRLLGRAAYGSLAFGLAIVGVVAVLAQFGLGTAVARTIASHVAIGDNAAVRSTTQAAVTIVAVAGGLAAVVVVAAVIMLETGLDLSSRILLGAGLGALLFGTNAAATVFFVARGVGRLSVMETPNLVLALGQLAWICLLAAMNRADVGIVAIGYGVVGVGASVVALATIQRLVPGSSVLVPAFPDAVRLLSRAGPYAIAGIAVQTIALADVLVLGIVRSSSEVGGYEPLLRLLDRVMLTIPALFVTGFMPAATSLFAGAEREQFADLYHAASRAAFVFSFPAVLLFAIFPRFLPRLLYGPEFPVSTGLVWLLLIGYVINLTFGLNTGALVATGDRRKLLGSYLSGLVVMVVLAGSLIPAFGAVGAAIATSASYAVLNGMVAWSLFRVAAIQPVARSNAITVGSGVALVLVAAAVARVIGPVGGAGALGVVGLVWLVWVFSLLVLGAFPREDLVAFVPLGRGSR